MYDNCLKHKKLIKNKKPRVTSHDLKLIICYKHGCRKQFKTEQGLIHHLKYSFYHSLFNDI